MAHRIKRLSLALLLCCAGLTQTTEASPKLDKRNTPSANAKAAVSPQVAAQGLGMSLEAALINDDGTLIQGSGTTGSSQISTGQYEVDFNRDVSACFYSVTPEDTTVLVLAQPRGGNANGVFVLIEDRGGNLVNASFYITVYCAK